MLLLCWKFKAKMVPEKAPKLRNLGLPQHRVVKR
jgi:hypothetical protein